MRKKANILIIIAHFVLSSCANSKNFVLYQKGVVQPVLSYKNTPKSTAEEFVSLFKTFGTTLKITNSATSQDKPSILLEIDGRSKGFSMKQDGSQLLIVGASNEELRKGARYFFTNYTALNQFTIQKGAVAQNEIIVPIGLNYQSNTDLEYIEPYFAQNFDENFRLWNNTNTLENSWALWGHNIGKFVKISTPMFAVIEGKQNEEQLNFSSKELQQALETAIAEKISDNPEANKFMIMPYDNELVCQCEACIAIGNTKTNASPAVYALIEKLADKFPKALFFSTAYISTETPPIKRLKSNVGVMISTMSFPKGVVLEKSNKLAEVTKKLADWKNVTSNIYLWDYAINFDNYFDAYPTVSIAQKNLSFLLENGVRGVFMHGSDEGQFAAFGDLKVFLYAQLYNNPQVDLTAKTKLFFDSQYPSLAKELTTYYLGIEKAAINNNKTLDIYGGIQSSVNKYLNYVELNKLIDLIISKKASLTSSEKLRTELLLMSFIFQKLELLRYNGISENGYATYQNGKVVLKEDLNKSLALLKSLSVNNQIDIYNESRFTLTQYQNSWANRIISKPYQNLFFKKDFKVVTKLDEDYQDIKSLNNGSVGFYDYYNNWLINSEPEFILETSTAGLEKATTLDMDFMQNKRHKIYQPEKITVFIGERKYETILKATNEDNSSIIKTTTPIQITANDSTIRIVITKQTTSNKRSIACDEIIFK